MKGEKEFFRKRIFGGFNREDVVKYIAKIADERNDAIAAKEKAERELKALGEELKKLHEQKNEPFNAVATEETTATEEMSKEESFEEEPIEVETDEAETGNEEIYTEEIVEDEPPEEEPKKTITRIKIKRRK